MDMMQLPGIVSAAADPGQLASGFLRTTYPAPLRKQLIAEDMALPRAGLMLVVSDEAFGRIVFRPLGFSPHLRSPAGLVEAGLRTVPDKLGGHRLTMGAKAVARGHLSLNRRRGGSGKGGVLFSDSQLHRGGLDGFRRDRGAQQGQGAP